MADKSFFIDTSKCMACRGCQVACKQWNKNGTEKTFNRGSHQNPPDLSPTTFKLVRFNEVEEKGKLSWYFFPEQCRHCLEPSCKERADGLVKSAIVKDEETGAVLYTELTRRLNASEIITSCPYNIPRADKKSKRLYKCTMCIDRVKNNLLPACVKTCPTGAMSFGERAPILAKAQKRLTEVKKKYPKAALLDPDDVRVIYLVVEDREKYHRFASAEERGISRKAALQKLLKPVALAAVTLVPGGMIQRDNR
jgi:formate dehydrogenase iron-sulfur subunit